MLLGWSVSEVPFGVACLPPSRGVKVGEVQATAEPLPGKEVKRPNADRESRNEKAARWTWKRGWAKAPLKPWICQTLRQAESQCGAPMKRGLNPPLCELSSLGHCLSSSFADFGACR